MEHDDDVCGSFSCFFRLAFSQLRSGGGGNFSSPPRRDFPLLPEALGKLTQTVLTPDEIFTNGDSEQRLENDNSLSRRRFM